MRTVITYEPSDKTLMDLDNGMSLVNRNYFFLCFADDDESRLLNITLSKENLLRLNSLTEKAIEKYQLLEGDSK